MGSFAKIASIIIIFAITFSTDVLAKTKKNKPKIQKKTTSQSWAIHGSGNLTAFINNAINNVDSNLSIGIAIKSMKYGDMLYTRNFHRPLVPASIIKVVTAEAALLYLGSNYTFKTNFYTDATSIQNGVVNGNLYLVHSGDPSLKYGHLVELIDSLKAQQIKQINGNVFIDTSAYDQVNYGPVWIWNDKRYCYGAPISASIINHNCLSFQIEPGKSVGHPANIVHNSQHFFSFIQNDVTTEAQNTRSCYIRLGVLADNSISVSGCMPRGSEVQGVTTVIGDVVEYNKALLRSLFKGSDITINGIITGGSAPSNLSVIATHESKPLHQLTSVMLKKSDNVIAGSLFKKLGALYSKQPGSWENGSFAITQILSQIAKVNTANMSVLDGSGLSPYNQITPSQMLQLLEFAFHHPQTNYDFVSSLAISGVDGTLKHRLTNIPWKVRAKTGTLKASGVNALAGYIVAANKEPLAFVIMVNGKIGMGWRYRELEDEIVTAMSRYSR